MKIVLFILAALLLLLLLLIFYVKGNEGNSAKYSVRNMTPLADSPLKGKTLIFLGSSVTVGAASGKEAVADMIAHKHGANVIKEAVSGTTLTDKRSRYGGGRSYIDRMKDLDTHMHVDALILQLSTNDATTGQPLGKIGDSRELSDFDTKTILGAMEYIIAYARKTWHCPVLVYSGPDFHNETYRQMNEAVKDLQKKWDIGFIDLFDDPDINTRYITKEYMADAAVKPIHPTKKGYQAWLPYFEKEIISVLSENE